MKIIDERTEKVLKEFQNNFKIETRPFKRIAVKTGLTEEKVITIIAKAKEDGIIRRVGIGVRPALTGFGMNALTAWSVPPDKVDSFGEAAAEIQNISHCYDRECPEGWIYNIFTMIHASDREELENIIKSLSERFPECPYKVMETLKELKKTSMKYFK